MYEIVLMRLFSIIQWHHFAYMIISLALLGFGMSGTFITIAQGALLRKYCAVYLSLIMLFGLSSFFIFQVVQNIPFNALEIMWDQKQSFYLLTMFVLLALPFFFSGSAICLTLRYYGSAISSIYGFDLVGAGLGSLAIIGLLYICHPQIALLTTSCLILITASIGAWELVGKKSVKFIILTCLMILPLLWFGQHLQLRLSPYKGLTQSLRIKGTQLIQERSSPLGLISVVESSIVPLRHAPGMSLKNSQEPLNQLGIFTDGDNISVLTAKAERRDQLAYLDQLTSALPYHLKKPENVLILGAGAGVDILQAQYHAAVSIDAVEMNPQIPQLVRDEFGEFGGAVFDNASTKIHVAEIRDYVQKAEQSYDIIQLSLTDGFAGSAAGVYALNESYIYTVEAIGEYLERLSPDGYLTITRWIKMPPRDTLKILATVVESLRNKGVEDPARNLVLIRSWQTSTLLVKNGSFSTLELLATQQFCEERSFDIAFTSAIAETQVNRYNILQQPLFYQAAKALTGNQADSFIQNYKYAIQPATDGRPYFHHFFKWSALMEIISLRQQGSAPLLESGYLVLFVTLIVACVMSAILILVPLLLVIRKSEFQSSKSSASKVLSYFFVIGMAFFFIEISFLQKFILFLHHPVLSIATVLSTFLIFAGIGSSISAWVDSANRLATLILMVMGIALLSLVYVFFLDKLFLQFATQQMTARILISISFIAPLALCMGFPFPLALQKITATSANLVPWAWGINGCASVISATLATLLAIHFGFAVLILLAVSLYVVAVWLFFINWK